MSNTAKTLVIASAVAAAVSGAATTATAQAKEKCYGVSLCLLLHCRHLLTTQLAHELRHHERTVFQLQLHT